MYFDKFKEINETLIANLQESELNYARLILPTKKGEVSVVGKYNPKFFGDCYITLNKDLNIIDSSDFNEFYYGASPKLDSSLIIEAISKLKLTSVKALENFIAENSTLFMLHKEQKKYLVALAKYIVIAISYNYGIKINFKNVSISSGILDEINSNNNFITQKDSFLIIRGCPTGKFLDELNKYQYIYKDSELVAVSDNKEAITINDVYQNKNNISLIDTNIYYSGVLARTLRIEEKETHHSNKGITSLYMYYERSTYATVFALDKNFTKHPLIEGEKKIIIDFFKEDDKCKRKYLRNPIDKGEEGRKKLLSDVNEYLKHSYNVNQIGVTANVISSDNYLIFWKRAKQSEDPMKMYPSVNGNAEIVDENVEFYLDSVDVDYPTIRIDKAMNSFGLEICREAEAELNLALNNNLLKCYGVAISGIIHPEIKQEETYPFTSRRLHFNILFKQNIDLEFKKVQQLQKVATEKYENDELHGLIVKTYKGVFDFLRKQMDSFLRKLMKSKLLITSLFTIALFFLSLNTINYSLKDWSTRVSFIFAVLVVLIAIIDVIKSIKEKVKTQKYRHTVTIIIKENYDEQIDLAINKFFKKHKYHPITYVALKLYLIDILNKYV